MRSALALAVVFAVVLPGAAAAQLPDDAALVAGPTASGARLYVWDQGGYLCGSVVRPRARGFGSSCGTPPESLRRPHISSRQPGSGPNHLWGIVAPEVASVEVVFVGGRRLEAQTTAGDRYQGRRAGRFRFFLVEGEWSRATYPLYVRLLSADGALLAAVSADAEPGRPARRSLVARGRLGRTRWSLHAFTRLAHAPLLGDEERVVTRRCIGLSVRGRGNSPQGGGAQCDEPDYPAVPLLNVERTCGPVGVQVTGMVERGVRVEAVLGDGRRVQPRLIRLPRRFGALRAFVLVLEPEVALRSLATVEGGRRDVQIAGIGPGIADCPNTSSGWILGFPFGMPSFGPGPPALQLRDNGVLLCATLGLPDPDDHDCGPPPLEAENAWVLTRATADGTTVAGVVTSDVASVEIVFADGERQVVPTTQDTYPGRYRGLIRSFSLSVPGEREPRVARLYGVDGGRLASLPFYLPPEFVRPAQTVLRSPGGWKLAAGITSGVAQPRRRFSCLQLTRGKLSDDVFSCTGFGASKQVRVACRPRRTLLYGQVDAGVRRVDVRTTRGTTRASIASLRRLGISRRAFLAELPAAAALRELVITGERVRRVRMKLPPASRQCGYDESVSFR